MSNSNLKGFNFVLQIENVVNEYMRNYMIKEKKIRARTN